MRTATDLALALTDSQDEEVVAPVNRLSLGGILEAGPILNSIRLLDVPRNSLLVKGVLTAPNKSILLMDMRLSLSGWPTSKTDPAIAVIVEVAGKEVGLILDAGAAA